MPVSRERSDTSPSNWRMRLTTATWFCICSRVCPKTFRQCKCWSIETLFYEVTQTLSCEIKTPCYPAAALLVFCLALKAAVRAAHGE
ncbi:MAG: hypothetical protein K8T89_03450 [Planctomycetes bacterium]|nr:hypothetical protein [Planctomycetota bacterium]